MPVDTPHPSYAEHREEWDLCRAALRGETAIKSVGETYLPKPSAFATLASGEAAYEAYRARARFPDLTRPTLSGMVGLIHSREFEVEGLEEGTPLAYLWESCTREGLTLEAFSQQITAEILSTGRYAILADPPGPDDPAVPGTDEDGLPLLAGYAAENLLNWDEADEALFVLDESRWERDEAGFDWIWRRRFRELRLAEGRYEQVLHVQTSSSGDDPAFEDGEVLQPTATGGDTLDEIPLVVVGPRTTGLPPEVPPLLGVARAALAAYQLDADYRHQLFWSGQETLVFSGMNRDEVPAAFGSGVAVVIQDKDGRAEYVGPGGTGIDAHREAIKDAKADAAAAGAQLFDTVDAPSESGRAKKIRYTATTATLRSVAIASAAALEASLRWCAVFLGEDPGAIVVKPNLEFVEAEMTAQEAVAMMTLWQSGAISYETFYQNLRRGRIASEERTAEEEQELVDEESPDQAQAGGDLLAPAPGDTSTAGDPGADRFVETGEGLQIEEAPA